MVKWKADNGEMDARKRSIVELMLALISNDHCIQSLLCVSVMKWRVEMRFCFLCEGSGLETADWRNIFTRGGNQPAAAG